MDASVVNVIVGGAELCTVFAAVLSVTVDNVAATVGVDTVGVASEGAIVVSVTAVADTGGVATIDDAIKLGVTVLEAEGGAPPAVVTNETTVAGTLPNTSLAAEAIDTVATTVVAVALTKVGNDTVVIV